MVIRLVFVVSTLALWDAPMTLLFVRVNKGLVSFVIIAGLRPYDKANTTKLELINEMVLIFLVDCIVV